MVPFWVVGHRGSPCEEVENTLPSFERALERDGANALEMDICVTRDDELLVWHDFDPASLEARLRQWNLEPANKYRPRTFDRTVRDMTLAEARRTLGHVDVESHLPTLGEVFDWSRAHPRLGLVFLDMKIPEERVDLVPVFLRRLERIAAEHAPRFSFVLESGRPAVVSELRRLGARHPLALDVYDKGALDAIWRLGVEWGCVQKPFPGQALFPFFSQKRLIRRLRRHHVVEPCAFTINEESEMRALLDLGVSAILTDRPARLRSVVDRRLRPLAPALATA